MRVSRAILASVLVLAAVATAPIDAPSAKAPKKSAAPPAPKAPTAEDARIKKLARVLRATDRRIVDDDILGLLGDADPAVRAGAARGLGQIADKKTLPRLLEATADADPAVQEAAAFALGLLDDPAATDRLQAMAAAERPTVRRAVAAALGMLHAPASREALGRLLGDADVTVRAQANLSVWKFAEPAPLLDALIGNTGSQDARVRATSCYALARLASLGSAPPSSGATVGRLPDGDVRRARAALVARASDKEAEVRMQVARGLAKPVGGEVAVVGTLTGDRDPRVRVNAVRALGFPGTPLRPYLDRAVADVNPSVGRAAVEALGKACGGDIEAKLRFLMPKYIESWRREAVLSSLAQCDPGEIPGIVEGLLMNPDPVMRLSAVPLVAAHTDAKGARDALAKLLVDPDARVQAAAIPVVAAGDGALGTLLAPVAEAKDPVVRAAIAEAYGARLEKTRPGSEPPEALLAAVDGMWEKAAGDSLPDARLALLDAAAKAGNAGPVRAILERGLSDREVVVRRRAAALFQQVLGEDRTASIGPASDRTIASYEAIVRWSLSPHAAVVTLSRPGFAPGRFTIALDAQVAPMTASNFVDLAGLGFFDNRVVHRVVPNFVVQDGDPRGDGYGGPGYTIRDEFNAMSFTRGVVGMASDGKDTAGSQWFVVLSDQPHLDGRYTAFAHVVQGQREVVGEIRPGDKVVSIRVYDGDGTEPLPKN